MINRARPLVQKFPKNISSPDERQNSSQCRIPGESGTAVPRSMTFRVQGVRPFCWQLLERVRASAAFTRAPIIVFRNTRREIIAGSGLAERLRPW